MLVSKGDVVSGGAVIAQTPETPQIMHKVIVPPGIGGRIDYIAPDGEYTVSDVIAEIADEQGNKTQIKLSHRCRYVPRPYKNRIGIREPLLTGQRIIDTLFLLQRAERRRFPAASARAKR